MGNLFGQPAFWPRDEAKQADAMHQVMRADAQDIAMRARYESRLGYKTYKGCCGHVCEVIREQSRVTYSAYPAQSFRGPDRNNRYVALPTYLSYFAKEIRKQLVSDKDMYAVMLEGMLLSEDIDVPVHYICKFPQDDAAHVINALRKTGARLYGSQWSQLHLSIFTLEQPEQ